MKCRKNRLFDRSWLMDGWMQVKNLVWKCHSHSVQCNLVTLTSRSAEEKDFRSQFSLSQIGSHPLTNHGQPHMSRYLIYSCFTAAPRHAAAYTLNYLEYCYLMILPCHSEKKEKKNELRKSTNPITKEGTSCPDIR